MGWLGKDIVESGPLLLLVYHHPALCTIPLQGTAGITGSTTYNNSGLFASFQPIQIKEDANANANANANR